ncbi:unnamed protein product, partial [Linum tenue]
MELSPSSSSSSSLCFKAECPISLDRALEGFMQDSLQRFLVPQSHGMGSIFLLVSLCTNPIWLVKTRFQLQTHHQSSRPYSGLY